MGPHVTLFPSTPHAPCHPNPFAMSQAERNPADVEMGDRTGMFTASRPGPHQFVYVHRRGLPRLASFIIIESSIASGIQLWRWI